MERALKSCVPLGFASNTRVSLSAVDCEFSIDRMQVVRLHHYLSQPVAKYVY